LVVTTRPRMKILALVHELRCAIAGGSCIVAQIWALPIR
jgi:hypothetical protein